MPTAKSSINEYNKNYKEWMAKKGLGHSHLEKPAMYSLIGNVEGKKILCLGCGAGDECAHLVSLGAKVTGMDISKSLINEAKARFPDLDFEVMDMENLKYKNSQFDIVYSSLVLHYVKDWTKVLSEVKKVLKKGGIFLFSTHNPVHWSAEKIRDGKNSAHLLGFERKNGLLKIFGDYQNTRKINDTWFENFNVTFYHKSFSSIMKDIISSKLQIVDVVEPKPLYSAKNKDLQFWQKNSKLALFIIFKLKK